jgi:hypothetical protein
VLADCETVVLARENAEKPYHFTPVAVLKGAVDETNVEAFVDSTSRRKLRRNPGDAVVLARRQGAETDWRRIAYADRRYQRFVRAILKNTGDWEGFTGAERRIAFFAERLTSDHRLVRQQAYLEVGRAPYASIKTIAGSVPRDQILRFLANWRLIEWHNLYILMLAQSRLPEDLAYIRRKFESAARYGLETNLSAWTTAFVETHPDTALERIETLYFGNARRTRKELEAVFLGLSVLGSEGGVFAGPDLLGRRHRIVRSYGVLLEHHPPMAGRVARDLMTWQIRAFVDRLSTIARSETLLDSDTVFAMDYYLSMAGRFPELRP